MEIVRSTVGDILTGISARYPDHDAVIHRERGVRFNYDLLSWEVDRAARGLIRMGFAAEDRVGLWAPNIPEWIVSMLALSRIGAVVVPVDPGAGREDLQFILAQSECRGIIASKGVEDEDYLDTVLYARDRIEDLETVVIIADETFPETVHWTELTAMGEDMDPGLLNSMVESVRPEDPVAIMYTSGTTGRPKGVVLDHIGLINKSVFSTGRQGLTHEDRICLFFPLFHMFGNTCIALSGIIRGAALIMPSETFDPPAVLKSIEEEKCTAVYGSPSMLIGLLDHPRFQKKGWKTVTKGIVGGAPCPAELMKRLVEDVGVSDLTVAYGITETSSWITMTHPDDPLDLRVGTIGTALECNEVKIVDPTTGDDLPPGSQGELCTRGFLMKGYYKMPGITASVIDRDGWFHTGDLGQMDENGYFRITGRLKDVIVRDGKEINPVEVEESLYRHPEVSEVQVFGFPHPDRGQEVAAWIRLKKGSSLSEISLAAYARDYVDKQSLPHYFRIVSDFPMTRSGKVQKYRLAEMALEEYLPGKGGQDGAGEGSIVKKPLRSDRAPEAIGPYSQAIQAGDYLFTSGQVPVDPATGRLVEGGIREQARQVMENLGAVLEAGGADFSKVVKATVYLADINDFAELNGVYGNYFPSDPPARSAFQVAALPLGAKVEIEMVAFLG
ncbi:MAG: AMP-binding protein [Deltaproteobacteria bacterium]|nr:AMP-binding protein [Deltaproteobacteria bacterium]MBW2047370.1 AMP-binding protein [Deltaproteobacteria bacterium]MBW2110174.1 AMP-binding protein [Deltaproteobacteria bacterium]MBW2352686.1 AMP-binding protein [Deltaproteobacteria bacterium]